ncbi:hypothetical protein RSAG8_12887, partial [Rhizoctonia solani AG-8 WAC10335]
ELIVHVYRIPRAGSLHVLWEYAQSETLHPLFVKLVRVAPIIFLHILTEIEEHPIFYNDSKNPQTPVENQLAVALFRLGRHGNAACLDDVAFLAGMGHGTVALFTYRVITALLDLHSRYIRRLTDEERARERDWVVQRAGCPEFAPGIYQYDGSTLPLWQKPGLNGDAYWSRHCNYELNIQIGCTGSNLRITDYSAGCTGSAHDALAFRSTAAYRYPDYIFQGDEFAWTDSAYTVSYRTIPVHKAPANLDPWVRIFDKAVSRLRARSEHCNGLLKGRWQSLRGLRISINRRRDHLAAMRWVSACIILHNICVEQQEHDWDMAEPPRPDNNQVQVGGEQNIEQDAGARRRSLVEDYRRFRTGEN